MKKKSWTKTQKDFVRNNINKVSFAEMADKIGKSENAIRLFVHRERLQYKATVKRNLIVELLDFVFTSAEYFAPTREFYTSVGITQMRFWKLYRGETPPTEQEYNALLEHFNVSKIDLFENRQYKLFP